MVVVVIMMAVVVVVMVSLSYPADVAVRINDNGVFEQVTACWVGGGGW